MLMPVDSEVTVGVETKIKRIRKVANVTALEQYPRRIDIKQMRGLVELAALSFLSPIKFGD